MRFARPLVLATAVALVGASGAVANASGRPAASGVSPGRATATDEPGPTLECIVNREAWEQLPADLQSIVSVACQAATLDMISEYMARNTTALRQLEADPNVEILAFPPAVLAGLKALTLEVVEGIAGQDPVFAKVWESYRAFLAQSEAWQRISEQAYLETRI